MKNFCGKIPFSAPKAGFFHPPPERKERTSPKKPSASALLPLHSQATSTSKRETERKNNICPHKQIRLCSQKFGKQRDGGREIRAAAGLFVPLNIPAELTCAAPEKSCCATSISLLTEHGGHIFHLVSGSFIAARILYTILPAPPHKRRGRPHGTAKARPNGSFQARRGTPGNRPYSREDHRLSATSFTKSAISDAAVEASPSTFRPPVTISAPASLA